MFNVETFIDSVRERPALYMPNHEHYCRKEMRTRLWDEIGCIMYPDWNDLDNRSRHSKALLMQKKWKCLKDCFNREVRLQKTREPIKLRKRYEFYDKLSFLLSKRNPEQADASPQAKIRQTDDADFATRPPQATPPQTHARETDMRKRKATESEAFRDAQAKQARRAEDSDRLFLLSFASDMKHLPMSTKYWVKMKFSEIMHEAVMSLGGMGEEHEGESFDESTEEEGDFGCVS